MQTWSHYVRLRCNLGPKHMTVLQNADEGVGNWNPPNLADVICGQPLTPFRRLIGKLILDDTQEIKESVKKGPFL